MPTGRCKGFGSSHALDGGSAGLPARNRRRPGAPVRATAIPTGQDSNRENSREIPGFGADSRFAGGLGRTQLFFRQKTHLRVAQAVTNAVDLSAKLPEGRIKHDPYQSSAITICITAALPSGFHVRASNFVLRISAAAL